MGLPTGYQLIHPQTTFWLRFLFKLYLWIRFLFMGTPLGVTLVNNFRRGAKRGGMVGIGDPLKKS